jgi:2-oxo-4-hydroxy-4-carboxy-5-ureidoimidazoline decarboxylase
MGANVNEITAFDDAQPGAAAALIRATCASTRWIDGLVATRPHRTLAELTSASDSAIAELEWSDLLEALRAHPRIGERVAGNDREAQWSRQEQAGTATMSRAIDDELRVANVTYEDQFGFVFLICAAGKSPAQMLTELHGRLGHSPEEEHEVVRRELRDIVRLRLAKTFS